ncbi:MAG: PfkB family carbohydrate kinase [Methanomassiliicoccales archaeon]
MTGWKRLGRARKSNDLGVLGHVNLDIIYNVPRLPVPGTSINTSGITERAGGTALNIAIYASCLGVSTAIGSYVGEDIAPTIESALKKGHIDSHDIFIIPGERTPKCHIFSDPYGEQSYVIEQGAMEKRGRTPLWKHVIMHSKILHVATGDPVRYAYALQKTTYNLDPGQEIAYRYDGNLLKRLLSHTGIFFSNKLEFSIALKLLKLKKWREITDYCSNAIITAGARGAWLIETDGRRLIAAPQATGNRNDTVGAGDAFRAGFYAAQHRGLEIPDSIEYGNTMAAGVVSGRIYQNWKQLSRTKEKLYRS